MSAPSSLHIMSPLGSTQLSFLTLPETPTLIVQISKTLRDATFNMKEVVRPN